MPLSSMSSSAHRNLPFSLVDLTVAQASRRLSTGVHRPDVLLRRQAHSFALKTKSPPDARGGYLRSSTPSSSTKSRGRELLSGIGIARRRPTNIAKDVRRPTFQRPKPPAATILNDRVAALLKRPAHEVLKSGIQEEDSDEIALYYDERELQNMFVDLLAHPTAEAEVDAVEAPMNNQEILEAVAQRMIVQSDSSDNTSTSEQISSSSLASRLSARRKPVSVDEATEAETGQSTSPQPQLDPQIVHHSIVLRISDVVNSMELARIVADSTSTSAPVVVLSPHEWDALIHTCIDKDELEIAEFSLQLLKRSGAEVSEDLVNDLASVHASNGDVRSLLSLFAKLSISTHTERQRDLHIKAHLNHPSPEYNVRTALKALHNYEALALIPPVKSYTRVIQKLFKIRSAELHAHAWDLFSHMRYVGHTRPDPFLYSYMIRACAGTGFSHSGYASDPVRALDLWTEMTSEAGYVPTTYAYSSIIMACARSKDFAAEALRLGRELLDSYRDAYGHSLMQPTREIFVALLHAAKTLKDLPRARWILAEMLKMHDQDTRAGRVSNIAPDNNALMHVFHAYASYRPPFRRWKTKIVDEGDMKAPFEDAAEVTQKNVERTGASMGRFGATPPQTASEVLAEVDALFERVLEDTCKDLNSPQPMKNDTTPLGSFSRVLVGPKLINSYLSVHYIHGSLEESQRLYNEIFKRTGTDRSIRTFVEALERCCHSTTNAERVVAKKFADEIWPEWQEHEKTLQRNSSDARLIERAYAAMIRMCSLIGQLDRALYIVREFATRYPPDAITNVAPKSPLRSTRTMLYAARPIVHLTTPTEVQDDTVPPVLTHADITLLHSRLVDAGPTRHKELNYLTWLCKSYTGLLRKRRDSKIRA